MDEDIFLTVGKEIRRSRTSMVPPSNLKKTELNKTMTTNIQIRAADWCMGILKMGKLKT